MTVTNIILLVLGIVLLVFVVLFIVFKLLIRAMKKRRQVFLESPMFKNAILVDSMANFFGTLSAGRMQVRGTGLLALTRDGLAFKMYAGSREVNIAYRDINAVTIVKSFLGKTVFRDLIQITYKTPSGEETSAWYVKDLNAWVTGIKNHMPQIR